MSDKIVFRKGLLENLEDLPIAAPGFITNPGEERLVIGGVNGNVLLPNAKDIKKIKTSLNTKANKSELDKYYSLYDAINIASDTDLNDIKDIGNYSCKDASIASTLINSPFKSAGFTLKNERCTNEVSNYIRQTIITNSSESRTFVRNFASSLANEWSEWHEIAYKEDNDVLFEGSVALKDSTITLSNGISNYKFLMIYTSVKGFGCEIMQTDLEGSYVIRKSDIQNSATTRVVTFYELGLSKTSDKELTVGFAYKMEDANGVYTKEEGTADKNVNDFLRIYKIVGVK